MNSMERKAMKYTKAELRARVERSKAKNAELIERNKELTVEIMLAKAGLRIAGLL